MGTRRTWPARGSQEPKSILRLGRLPVERPLRQRVRRTVTWIPSTCSSCRCFCCGWISLPGAAGRGSPEGLYDVRGRIATPTTLTFARASGLSSADIAWFVVSMTNGKTVQAGTGPAAVGTWHTEVPLTSVDTSRAISLISSTGGRDGGAPWSDPDVRSLQDEERITPRL